MMKESNNLSIANTKGIIYPELLKPFTDLKRKLDEYKFKQYLRISHFAYYLLLLYL